MTIVRRLARPLLATPLIQTGLDAARHPGPQAELARPVLDRVSGPLKLPQDQIVVVRAAGSVTVAAGLLLAIGKLPRLSALAIVLAAPAVQNTQPFWKEKDPELRRAQRSAFLKNLGLLGGTLLAAVDTEGRPSLAWRGRRAGHLATEAARDAGTATAVTVRDVKKSTRKSVRNARKAAKKTQRKALKEASRQGAKASKAAGKVRASVPV
jgi:putative oxidoreductase